MMGKKLIHFVNVEIDLRLWYSHLVKKFKNFIDNVLS